MKSILRLLALLVAAAVVIPAGAIGLALYSTWDSSKTSTLLGGGLAVAGICALAAPLAALAFVALLFLDRRDRRRAPQPSPDAWPAALPSPDALSLARLRKAEADADRAALAALRDRRALEAPPPATEVWQPTKGQWVSAAPPLDADW